MLSKQYRNLIIVGAREDDFTMLVACLSGTRAWSSANVDRGWHGDNRFVPNEVPLNGGDTIQSIYNSIYLGYYAEHISPHTETRNNSTVRVKADSKGIHLHNLSYAGPIVMGCGGKKIPLNTTPHRRRVTL